MFRSAEEKKRTKLDWIGKKIIKFDEHIDSKSVKQESSKNFEEDIHIYQAIFGCLFELPGLSKRTLQQVFRRFQQVFRTLQQVFRIKRN